MTASILSQLPLTAGSVLLTNLGRGAQWALSRYMRAPASSTAILALVTMSAMAGSNALYFQTERHPSPFFAQDSAVPYAVRTSAAPAVAPVPAPASMREEASQTDVALGVAPQTTGSVAAQPQSAVIPDRPVGNAEVFAVQKKLAELKLFDGTVDGYYGPRTARAIRAFEEQNGFTPLGALSSGIVSAILGADGQGRAAGSVPAPQPVATPAPAPQPLAVAAPVVQEPPVALAAAAPVAPQQDEVIARLPSIGPVEAAVDTVGTAAANTIDSIVAAVDGTLTARPVSNPPTPSAAIPTQAMPAPVAALKPVVAAQAKPAVAPQRAARPATDRELVSDIQRGLASLGFFRGTIDGNPGPETARAIREFENFHRYKVTGQVQPDLIDLLRNAGAAI